MVRFWDDPKDIKTAIGETLSHFARREDLAGWVRSSLTANVPALADEIARLSKENGELHAELRRAKLSSERGEVNFGGVGFGELKKILETKHLLGLRKQHRLELGKAQGLLRPESDIENKKLQELCVIGVLSSVWNAIHNRSVFKLTDTGRAFLNKLEAQKKA